MKTLKTVVINMVTTSAIMMWMNMETVMLTTTAVIMILSTSSAMNDSPDNFPPGNSNKNDFIINYV